VTDDIPMFYPDSSEALPAIRAIHDWLVGEAGFAWETEAMVYRHARTGVCVSAEAIQMFALDGPVAARNFVAEALRVAECKESK